MSDIGTLISRKQITCWGKIHLHDPFLASLGRTCRVSTLHDTPANQRLFSPCSEADVLSINGSCIGGAFNPIPELCTGDSLLTIVFLSSNHVPFIQRTTDDWYTATTLGERLVLGGYNGTLQTYLQNEAASPLACLQREQICDPSLPEGHRCTPLGSFADLQANVEALVKDQDQLNRISWTYDVLTSPSQLLADVIAKLHSSALLARYSMSANLQGPLPDNQWQLEVQFWFATIMAQVQQAFIRAAMGPSSPDLDVFSTPPESDASKELCRNQVRRDSPCQPQLLQYVSNEYHRK